MYLSKMTTAQAKEAFAKDPILVIPVGSTEPARDSGSAGHGFHGALLSGGPHRGHGECDRGAGGALRSLPVSLKLRGKHQYRI